MIGEWHVNAKLFVDDDMDTMHGLQCSFDGKAKRVTFSMSHRLLRRRWMMKVMYCRVTVLVLVLCHSDDLFHPVIPGFIYFGGTVCRKC